MNRYVILIGIAAGCVTMMAETDVAQPGTYDWSMTHAGLTRTYHIHIPATYRASKPAALVLAFHGSGGTEVGTEKTSGLSPLSDREGFIAVYPDGFGKTWNDGRRLASFPSMRDNLDDVGFVSALIDELGRKLAIDRRRVFATGISNGGHMVNRLGVELSEKIAAIAPVAATIDTTLAAKAGPGKPVAVIDFHGTADPMNYWKGNGKMGGITLSVPDLIQFWVKRDGCAAAPKVEPMPDKVDDGTTVKRESYGHCKAGAEVVLYAIEGGGHTWPGGPLTGAESRSGRTTQDINASELMWEFFTRHPKAVAE